MGASIQDILNVVFDLTFSCSVIFIIGMLNFLINTSNDPAVDKHSVFSRLIEKTL